MSIPVIGMLTSSKYVFHGKIGEIDMKKYYPIEDAINNVSKKFRLNLKDSNEMDEKELEEAEMLITEYVEFVEHPEYVQLVPKMKRTNELIL